MLAFTPNGIHAYITNPSPITSLLDPYGSDLEADLTNYEVVANLYAADGSIDVSRFMAEYTTSGVFYLTMVASSLPLENIPSSNGNAINFSIER